jgi:hypothetical protein
MSEEGDRNIILRTREGPNEQEYELGIENRDRGDTLFFLEKHILRRPSHSSKLTGGGGFFGTIFTTEDSTCGGGRKLFFPTYH